MIFRMPGLHRRFFFVASSSIRKLADERAITDWARSHGYTLAPGGVRFYHYQDGVVVREWSLVQQDP